MASKRVLALVLAAACGDDGMKGVVIVDAAVDGAVDAPKPGDNVVSIEVYGDAPVFIRYREGTGPWLEPKQTSSGYEMQIDERYELIAVCGDSLAGFEIGVEGNTYQESQGLTFVPCFGPYTPLATHKLSGTMVQPGSVTIGGDSATSTTANWSFELDAEEGNTDLLAVGGGRARLLRDLAVTMPMTLPALDVAASPLLASVPLTVTGTQTSDMLRTGSYLSTFNAFLSLGDEAGTTARVLADSELLAMDRQYVFFFAQSTSTHRTAFWTHNNTSPITQVTLLPPLDGIQFAGAAASWTTLPSGGRELQIYSSKNSWRMFATEGWLGTKTSLAIDTEIPGFMPEWKPSSIDFISFDVNRYISGISLRTGVQQSGPMVTGKRLYRSPVRELYSVGGRALLESAHVAHSLRWQ